MAARLGRSRPSAAYIIRPKLIVTTNGGFDLSLNPVEMDFTGSPTPPEGDFSLSLSPVTMSAAGSTDPGGGFSLSLSPVTVDVEAGVQPSGSIAMTLSTVDIEFGTETVPFGEQVFHVEKEKRSFWVIDDDPGLIPIYVDQIWKGGSFGMALSPTSMAGAGNVGVIYADDFNRADNTSLGSTSVGSLAWTEEAGTSLSIVSNTVQATGTSDTRAYVTTGFADGDITLQLSAIGTRAGIYFRTSNSGNDSWRFGRHSSTQVAIYKQVAGSAATTTFNCVVSAGDTLRVLLSGSSIKCYANSTLCFDLTDSFNSTSTKHGLFIIETGSSIDNWTFLSP